MARIRIRCSDCGWEYEGEEYDTEVAYDIHCYENHPAEDEEDSDAITPLEWTNAVFILLPSESVFME